MSIRSKIMVGMLSAILGSFADVPAQATQGQAQNEFTRRVTEALRRGDLAAAIQLAEEVEAEEIALDSSLEALLIEIERFTQESADRAEEHESEALRMLIMLSLFALVFGMAGSALVVRAAVARPLGQMTGAMRRLAEGDETVEVPATRRGDEVGEMARAVLVFKENLIRNRELTEQQKTKHHPKKKQTPAH